MSVISIMKNRAISYGVAVSIFVDRYHLVCDFFKVQFDYVPREWNSVAYEIARLARGCASSMK
jgi:hypothetical protein